MPGVTISAGYGAGGSVVAPHVAKLLGVSAMSNVLGTINPVRELADAAHAAGALILVDGAQQAPHLPTDVRALDVDFFGCTGRVNVRAIEHVEPVFQTDIDQVRGMFHVASAPGAKKIIAGAKCPCAKT